jgi:hypothetical protein
MEPRIVYCHCAYAQVVPPEVKQQVLQQLTASDRSFEAVADLCEMAARRDPCIARIAASGPVRIAACYPRAVRMLFVSAGSPLAEAVQIVNMRTASGSEAAEMLLAQDLLPAEADEARVKAESPEAGEPDTQDVIR